MSPTLYKIQGIPSTAITHFWPFAIPYIKRALDHGHNEYLESDFKKFCLDRSMQLWLILHDDRIIGAATTEIINYPQQKHCRIVTIAGSNFTEWCEQTATQIESWAKAQNCSAMEAFVRKGFVQKLIPLGYSHKQSIVVKKIKEIGNIKEICNANEVGEGA